MDTETLKPDEINLGKEIAKSFVVSTASSAGIYVGLGLVLFAFSKIVKAKEARDAKNTPTSN